MPTRIAAASSHTAGTEKEDASFSRKKKINSGKEKSRRSYFLHSPSRTLIVRISTAISVLIVCAVCSASTYFVIFDLEKQAYEAEYDSIANSAYTSTVFSAEAKVMGAKVLSASLSERFPEYTMWPNVSWSGFHKITANIVDLANPTGMGLIPIVSPEGRDTFQAHAYNYYSNNIDKLNGIDIDELFAVGVAKINPATGNRVPDTTGATSYGSPNTLLAPMLQVSGKDKGILLINLHAEPKRGAAIDNIIECVDKHVSKGREDSPLHCGSFTDTLDLITTEEDVSFLFLEPIFPADNATNLVGFIPSATVWTDILVDIVPDFVTGLDIVIESSGGSIFTFTVEDGKPRLRGEGDRHDSTYDSYKKGGPLVPKSNKLIYSGSVTYTVSFYPTDEFVEIYTTDLPLNATLVVVGIMLVTSIIFIVHDVVLKQESNERRAVLETKRKFVRFISHETRTPLNTVSLGLDLLRGEFNSLFYVVRKEPQLRQENYDYSHIPYSAALLVEKIQDWLTLAEDISVNTQSAVSVLNGLLNYDKIESGTLSLDSEPVNFWTLVKKAAKTFDIQAKQADVKLVVNLERHAEGSTPHRREQLRVMGDEMRLTQVLRNLISNALKFTPADGSVTLTCTWKETGLPQHQRSVRVPAGSDREEECPRQGSLMLTVTDTGAGLSESQLQRIFGEGIQFNAAVLQAGQGSGLGLAIAKGIAVQHGGTLEVSSEGLGRGCIFTLELPAYCFSSEAVAAYLSQLSTVSISTEKHVQIESPCRSLANNMALNTNDDSLQTPPEKFLSTKKLLVVDDAALNRKMLIRLLQTQGHQCVEAKDGLGGIEEFTKCAPDDPFDCILMDNQMPNMDGPTAASRLRELGWEGLIIGVSGNVLKEDVQHYKSMGANAVLPKPLNMTDLEEIWQDQQSMEDAVVAAAVGQARDAAQIRREKLDKQIAERKQKKQQQQKKKTHYRHDSHHTAGSADSAAGSVSGSDNSRSHHYHLDLHLDKDLDQDQHHHHNHHDHHNRGADSVLDSIVLHDQSQQELALAATKGSFITHSMMAMIVEEDSSGKQINSERSNAVPPIARTDAAGGVDHNHRKSKPECKDSADGSGQRGAHPEGHAITSVTVSALTCTTSGSGAVSTTAADVDQFGAAGDGSGDSAIARQEDTVVCPVPATAALAVQGAETAMESHGGTDETV